MTDRRIMRLGLTIVAGLAAAPAAAQPVYVENGKIERHPAAPDPPGAFRGLVFGLRAPAWLGYEAPASARQRMCCYDSTREIGPCAGCRLESMRAFTFGPQASRAVDLEGPARLIVLFRAQAGRVDRVRALSPDCGIELGGLTLHWLEGVRPAHSLGLLAGLVSGAERRDEVWEPAVSAVALHADPGADALLIRLARRNPSRDIRSQALFWLAQRAGDQAIAAIRAAIADDPEIEVKRQAVFALSELPNDEGVPLLIEIARTHRHPEVRRQAFFWLGESEDPRALAFFEEILAVRPTTR